MELLLVLTSYFGQQVWLHSISISFYEIGLAMIGTLTFIRGIRKRNNKANSTVDRVMNVFIILTIARIFTCIVSIWFNYLGDVTEFLSIGPSLDFIMLMYILQKTKLNFDKLWRYGFIFMLLNCIVAIMQYALSKGAIRGYGYMGSAFFNFALPFFLYSLNNMKPNINKAFVIISAVAIFTSEQRTLVAMAALTLVIHYLLTTKKFWDVSKFFKIVGALVLTISMAFYLSPAGMRQIYVQKYLQIIHGGGTIEYRYILWDIAWKLFQKFPFIGIGSGGFGRLLPKYLDLSSRGWVLLYNGLTDLSPHNTFLKILSETGLIGVIVYYTIPLLIIRYLWRKRSSIIVHNEKYSYLLSCIISLTIYDAFGEGTMVPYYLFIVILAISVVKQNDAERVDEKDYFLSSWRLFSPIKGVAGGPQSNSSLVRVESFTQVDGVDMERIPHRNNGLIS